jgi:FixJ family two-component response regulator
MTKQPLVAVVDDEEPVRKMLGRVLRLEGYEVAAFGCGQQFIASLQHRRPACVVLDIHLPNLSGFEVQGRLHQIDPSIPVVFITASDDPALTQQATEAHGIALLRKPFSSQELTSAIETAFTARPRSSG